MFYPIDSLKRGGRFYLCWVADSWPLRFATITQRQLWSQDIREICDDLKEVMTNESGRPTKRYSLRLSSQLMRGLVRLYQRKVNFLLTDLCMINATVIKLINRKHNIHELDLHPRRRPKLHILELPPDREELVNERRIEEMIQNSGNVVTNIQDITLKEAVIPEFILPPNDGFGEEIPGQQLQLLADRTIEMIMLPTDISVAQHSGLELLAFDITDKSHDKSRLVAPELQMEQISEHDISVLRRSDGISLLPVADFEKEIPEISDIPIPDLPVPQEKQQEPSVEIPDDSIEKQREEASAVRETRRSQQIELEELEEIEPRAKKRRFRGKLIIDKKIKIESIVLRARIENPNVELRCQDSTDDIIDLKVPSDVYMRRPCHAGYKTRSNLSQTLTRLYMRNLAIINKPTRVERDIEEGLMQRSLRSHTGSKLDRIEEVEEPTVIPEITINQDNLMPVEGDLSKNLVEMPEEHREQDIADLLTQKLETLSQQASKRTSVYEAAAVPSPKRPRSIGYVSFRESQQKRLEDDTAIPVITEAEKQPEIPEFDLEVDKENVPANKQKQTPTRDSTKQAEKSVTEMLQEAGLADIPTYQPMEMEPPIAPLSKVLRKNGSESSETPLGSLDRTKVSLGDSEQTTDSRRFIREQWGTEGTMLKILKCIKEGKHAVTVRSLIARGPVIPEYKSIIAARCFTSILKLKHHTFIKIKKYPDTLEIEDITLGPKFH